MKKITSVVLSWIFVILIGSCSAQAKESYDYIEPFYYPQGLMAMFNGFSEAEYMDYVDYLDDSFGRVSNTSGEIKGFEIGRMASFYIDWNDKNYSDRQLASILLNEIWDVGDECQRQVDSVLSGIDSARVWLMGTETYGWGLDYDIPAVGEEFYLFRTETSNQKAAFVIACRYEVDGGESISFKMLEDK